MNASLTRSYRYCELLARKEAGNFYHAFHVLPRSQRRAMCALYAFLRVADDLSDRPGLVSDKELALARWRRQLHAALRGDFRHPLHEALQHTVHNFGVPCRYLEDVLDGVEMDLVQNCYATFPDLYKYCYRVASAVGLACIHIWGSGAPQAVEYAEKAGIAFQLTNILRDLGEDAARGRIYLPADELLQFNYCADFLRRGERSPSFRTLMKFQVDRARAYYELSWPLAGLLPAPGRAVFQIMWQTYYGLLDVIERRDYDVFGSRASLGRWRKWALVVQALPVRLGWV
jgi:15-cis-phytoene synthase